MKDEDADRRAPGPVSVPGTEIDPATRAFESLRAEVTVLRRAVEELPAAVDALRPVDTTPTLGAIVRELVGLRYRLKMIEQSPALKLTPHQQAQTMHDAVLGLVRDAVTTFNQVKSAADGERRELAALIGTSRAKAAQRQWLIWTAVAGIVAGLVLFPLLGSLLPVRLGSRMAALAMGEDRWMAGQVMIHAENPEEWRAFANGRELIRANADVLEACQEAARQSGKEQRCALEVPVPSQ